VDKEGIKLFIKEGGRRSRKGSRDVELAQKYEEDNGMFFL
jgi:hypothetical protein